jgi:hypothetical protein
MSSRNNKMNVYSRREMAKKYDDGLAWRASGGKYGRRR